MSADSAPAPDRWSLDQSDVDALRGLLDLMADFTDNDQRARYLLSSNWMRDRGAAAAARHHAPSQLTTTVDHGADHIEAREDAR